MTTADDYIKNVLDRMPPATPARSQIAAELRGHIAERLAGGSPLDDVLRQLGDPATLADAYLSAEPLLPAPFGRRALAKTIDALGVYAVMVPFAIVVALLARPAEPGLLWMIAFAVVMVGGSLTFVVYTILAEWRWGQTIAKRLLGLRVVRENGARIDLGPAIVRTVPMLFQFYWVDILFALFTEKNQRAFEMLSKTRVVRAR